MHLRRPKDKNVVPDFFYDIKFHHYIKLNKVGAVGVGYKFPTQYAIFVIHTSGGSAPVPPLLQRAMYLHYFKK